MSSIDETKQSDWDTDDHNYWLAESCRIAKVITSDQSTNSFNQSQQAIVRIQSEPNVATNQSKFNDKIIKPTTISINKKTEDSISPSSTGNNNISNFRIDQSNSNLLDVSSQIMKKTSEKKRTN